jgi:hypothetical protein
MDALERTYAGVRALSSAPDSISKDLNQYCGWRGGDDA